MSQAKVGAIMRNLALLTALVLFISGPVPVRGQSNDEPEIDLSGQLDVYNSHDIT